MSMDEPAMTTERVYRRYDCIEADATLAVTSICEKAMEYCPKDRQVFIDEVMRNLHGARIGMKVASK